MIYSAKSEKIEEIKNVKNDLSIYKRFNNAIVRYYPYYLMLTVPAIFIIIYKILPLFGLVIAFKQYYPRVGIINSEWVGLYHFKTFLQSPDFPRVLRNTIEINLLKLIVGFPASITLALIFNAVSGKYYKRTMQIISYMPQFLSWIIVYGFMYMLFNYNQGAINKLLVSLGYNRVAFLSSEKWIIPMIIFSYIWKNVGWGSIIYFAALGNISPDFYEAAESDGAIWLQKLLYITIPCLLPIMTIMFLIQIGTLLYGDFEQNLIFMGNSPLLRDKGEILETYMFTLGIGNQQYSFATAVGFFQSIFGASLVIISNYLMKKTNNYSIW